MVSLDWLFRPTGGIYIEGESAYADTDINKIGSSVEKNSGMAHRIRTRLRTVKSRIRLDYERVDPDFYTLGGAASKDRERAKTKFNYYLSKNANFALNYLWYRNNLKGQKSATTNVNMPEVSVSQTGLMGRRSLRADLGLSQRMRKTPGKDDQLTNTYTIRLSDRFNKYRVGLEYRNRDSEDKLDVSKATRCDVYSLDVNTRYRIGQVSLRPGIRYGLEYSRKKQTGNVDIRGNLGFTLRSEISRRLSFYGSYRSSSADYETSGIDDSRRNIYSCQLEYYLDESRNDSLMLLYKNSDNDFETNSRDYAENVLQLKYIKRL